VADPFCGSGTLLVEALANNRRAIGVDVDPVAVFISRVKSRPISPERLRPVFDRIQTAIQAIRRSPSEYDNLMRDDLAPSSLARLRDRLAIPRIPNMTHWFRTYVAVDLARLRQLLMTSALAPDVRAFFLACFASIIRNASNADPVPVSGLEVTKHMRELDRQGRRIDPFELFESRVQREIRGMTEFFQEVKNTDAKVYRADARRFSRRVRCEPIDAIITSPPYNTAVDYYRRHTLEMYWLDFVSSQDERLRLAPQYIGRERIRKRNRQLSWEPSSSYIKRLLKHGAQISPGRERALRHYCASMDCALGEFARVLKPNGLAAMVVGNAKWNGRNVRPTKVIEELAAGRFDVIERLTYRTYNRYMSYSRHNGANVNREYVVVLRNRQSPSQA
jgi:DNA modification methylase